MTKTDTYMDTYKNTHKEKTREIVMAAFQSFLRDKINNQHDTKCVKNQPITCHPEKSYDRSPRMGEK